MLGSYPNMCFRKESTVASVTAHDALGCDDGAGLAGVCATAVMDAMQSNANAAINLRMKSFPFLKSSSVNDYSPRAVLSGRDVFNFGGLNLMLGGNGEPSPHAERLCGNLDARS